MYRVRPRTSASGREWLIEANGGPDGRQTFSGLTMKFKLLHFQIATAALLAPVAVSLANTTKPASNPKPATRVAEVIMPVAQPAPVAQTAPAIAPTTCGSKVRIVYAGYTPPAQKGC